MKKFLSFVSAAALLTILTACQRSDTPQSEVDAMQERASSRAAERQTEAEVNVELN